MSLNNLYLILSISIYSFCSPYSDAIYNQVVDITDPTQEEYDLIQDYLYNGMIPGREAMIDWKNEPIPRDLRISPEQGERIINGLITVKSKRKARENCVILYASFNGDYSTNLYKTILAIRRSDFVGHIRYQIGGWPNTSAGDLVFCHLPRAFKACSFKAAYDLGYKKVLWLNAGMIPTISLNTIFERIGEDGIFGYLLPYSIRVYCQRNEHISALNISLEKAMASFCVSSRAIGLDLENTTSLTLFNDWYSHTVEKESFSFLPHSNICNLSHIIQKYYGKSTFWPIHTYVNTGDQNEEFTYDP